MGSKQIPAYPFDQRTPYMAFAHSSTDVQNFLLWAQENSPCVRAKLSGALTLSLQGFDAPHNGKYRPIALNQ